MKKIMMFVAVAVCAVVTQAASIDWASGTISIDSAKVGKGAVNGYLYLISQAEYNALDLSNANAAYNTYKAKTATATGSSNKSGLIMMTTNGNIGDTQYAVIIYETAADPVKFIITKGYDSINELGGQDNIASTDLFTNAGSSWAVPGGDTPTDPTPEPTSGLLLMIGAGVMALRRRVQK